MDLCEHPEKLSPLLNPGEIVSDNTIVWNYGCNCSSNPDEIRACSQARESIGGIVPLTRLDAEILPLTRVVVNMVPLTRVAVDMVPLTRVIVDMVPLTRIIVDIVTLTKVDADIVLKLG